jgi:hypothetical protein
MGSRWAGMGSHRAARTTNARDRLEPQEGEKFRPVLELLGRATILEVSGAREPAQVLDGDSTVAGTASCLALKLVVGVAHRLPLVALELLLTL